MLSRHFMPFEYCATSRLPSLSSPTDPRSVAGLRVGPLYSAAK